MMKNTPNGFYLFPKERPQTIVLKEMLQFLRTQHRGKSPAFAFVESETSLIPHLSLWENLHVVNSDLSWKELTQSLTGDWGHLINLIKEPDCLAVRANAWERMAVSLIKATLTNSGHVLVDLNEDLFSSFNLQLFKRALLSLSETRTVFIASTDTTLWADCSHGLVTREGYEFKVMVMDQAKSKIQRLG